MVTITTLVWGISRLILLVASSGSPLGLGLGLSDFVFLALFAAASRFFDLRYAATLLGVCCAAFLAVTAGLLLERPLPTLPFIAIAFVWWEKLTWSRHLL